MLGMILLEAMANLGAAIGAGIAAIAAGIGIGRIARQPESTNDIRSNMIVIAALIEGVAFFALIVCILAIFIK